MIEQVLGEIRDAEKRAAAIVEDALVRAREIAVSTAAECDAMRAAANEEIKLAVKNILAEAEKAADAEAALIAKDAEMRAQILVREAERNVRSAGEWIADMIIKGKC